MLDVSTIAVYVVKGSWKVLSFIAKVLPTLYIF
jgi:hypothetical protein